MIHRYRTKPVEKTAVRFDGTKKCYDTEVVPWVGKKNLSGFIFSGSWFDIKTLEGWMRVSPGDFVVQGLRGEFYPCKPDVFHKQYEVIPEPSPDSETLTNEC